MFRITHLRKAFCNPYLRNTNSEMSPSSGEAVECKGIESVDDRGEQRGGRKHYRHTGATRVPLLSRAQRRKIVYRIV